MGDKNGGRLMNEDVPPVAKEREHARRQPTARYR